MLIPSADVVLDFLLKNGNKNKKYKPFGSHQLPN